MSCNCGPKAGKRRYIPFVGIGPRPKPAVKKPENTKEEDKPDNGKK